MKSIIAVIFSVVILSSCGNKNDSGSRDIAVPVSVMNVSTGSIKKYVSITGTVKPLKEAQIKSEMSGNYKLLKNPSTGRPFSLNDRVNEGQELIYLQDAEYENNIRISSLKLSLETTKQLLEKQQSQFQKGGVTQNDVKNAEISYINAKYAYDDAMIRLEKTKIKAPFSGIVVDMPYYTPGIKVPAGSPVVSIMDFSKLYLDVYLSEKNMGVVKVNQPVLVTNYSLPDDTLKGVITQLSPAIDANSRSFKGTIEINNPNLKLRPGMYVKTEIEVASGKDAIVVPKEVVISKFNNFYVFIVEKGIAYERQVQTGLENNREIQVLSGLKPSDQLVVKGFETLRNESRVKVEKK